MRFLTRLVKHWFKLQATNPDEMFRERTVRGMVVIILFVMSVLILQSITLGALDRLAQFFAVMTLAVAAQFAVNKGKIHTAAWIVTLFGLLFFAINIFQVGYWLPGTFIAAFLALLLSAMLLPARSTRIVVILMIVLYAGGSIGSHSRGLVSPLPITSVYGSPYSASVTFAVIMLLLVGALAYLIAEFNARRTELKNLINTLEERVTNRTRDLNIAAQVAQQVNQVLDLSLLLPQLTELTRAGFNLYHVSVFLLDKETNILQLHAGTGEAGPKMVGQNKQFHLYDHGLVPRSAYLRQPQVSNDISLSSNHFVNPLLPLTRSEVALPMIVGDEIIGVLDLQSEQTNKFFADDIRVLTTLAEQIAVAVRNANLFADVQQARQEAEKANVVKSQFLASMSHELRTPLNAVLNFTQFVSSGMMGPVNDEQVDMLNKVVHSGQHLLSLINDVLDISKIEAGALKLFVESNINLSHEAQVVADSAQGLLGDKAVSLQIQLPETLPLISGDKRRIRQIMLNLVSNACKFTDEGSIRLAVEQYPDHLLFAVHDTGSGIAAEDTEAVFETFRQTTIGMREGGGTGLGLPISRRLAEAHGGRLWFESVVGQGTSFYVSLPINVKATNDSLNHVKEALHVT